MSVCVSVRVCGKGSCGVVIVLCHTVACAVQQLIAFIQLHLHYVYDVVMHASPFCIALWQHCQFCIATLHGTVAALSVLHERAF